MTGTHHGATWPQLDTFRDVLVRVRAKKLHEGDCIGADAQCAAIGLQLRLGVVAHPPIDPKRRAYAPASETRDPKPYIERDHDIVDETELLLGLPYRNYQERRSGTWTTLRYAASKSKTSYIILPTGELILFSGKPLL